jgi:hypothetical protein
VTHKKEISVIYVLTPVIDKDELVCLIGNMFDESSSPAFFKIDSDKIGSCCAIIEHPKIPHEFCPEIVLQSDQSKTRTERTPRWRLHLSQFPPLPQSLTERRSRASLSMKKFVAEMKSISSAHGFWAQMMRES